RDAREEEHDPEPPHAHTGHTLGPPPACLDQPGYERALAMRCESRALRGSFAAFFSRSGLDPWRFACPSSAEERTFDVATNGLRTSNVSSTGRSSAPAIFCTVSSVGFASGSSTLAIAC